MNKTNMRLIDILGHIKVISNKMDDKTAQIEELENKIKDASNAVTKIAFEMEAPNEYTPRLVQIALLMRAR